jgi:hypothetical protein
LLPGAAVGNFQMRFSALLGHYCRCTMMTARERKPKSGACLGGHWDMTRRVARALGPFYLRLLTILPIQQENSVILPSTELP